MTLLDEIGNERCYIVVYPCIAIKSIHVSETLLAEVYSRWPSIDYYKQYSSGSISRATPGTVKVYTPEDLHGNIGVVVVNYRFYPGNKIFPNDSESTRLTYFRSAFEILQSDPRISVLHLELPSLDPEYNRIIEDYKTTCMLNRKVSPIVNIHNRNRSVGRDGGRDGGRDEDNGGVNCLPLLLDVPSKVAIVKYRLKVPIEQISQTTLYAIDFAPFTIQKENGILKYFPCDSASKMKWNWIDDPQLCKFAIDVEKQLNPIIDTVFPPKEELFNAFKLIKDDIRVVIIGQDPYHAKPGQAHGLSFSVPKGIALPPSLRNVYKALEIDVGCTWVEHGCLIEWAQQGVLLLNTSLTVLQNQANCHAKIWKDFTDRLIQLIAMKHSNLVFMLWGEPAKKKRSLISANNHLILEFSHPSPLSRSDFSVCTHFSQANKYLSAKGKQPINWQLST